MSKNSDHYEIQTGLASDLNPVIKCNPNMYDRIIDECRLLVFENTSGKSTIEVKEFCRKYTALGTLAQHPKYSEVKKGN